MVSDFRLWFLWSRCGHCGGLYYSFIIEQSQFPGSQHIVKERGAMVGRHKLSQREMKTRREMERWVGHGGVKSEGESMGRGIKERKNNEGCIRTKREVYIGRKWWIRKNCCVVAAPPQLKNMPTWVGICIQYHYIKGKNYEEQPAPLPTSSVNTFASEVKAHYITGIWQTLLSRAMYNKGVLVILTLWTERVAQRTEWCRSCLNTSAHL